MKTKELAHEYLSKKRCFPKHYGKNLDALYDVLTSLRDVRIDIVFAGSITANLGDYGQAMLDVFRDAGENNEFLSVNIK